MTRDASSADSRDLRAGGRWTTRQRLKNASLYWLIRCLLRSIDRVPESWLLPVGRAIGMLVGLVVVPMRRRAEKALLGAGLAPTLGLHCFRCAGENLALSLCLRRPGVDVRRFVSVDASAEQVLRGALAAGRGAIVASAHLGPFELIAPRVAALGLKPAIVVRNSYDPRLDAIVDAHRTLQGLTVIHRGQPSAPFQIRRALREGRPVGMLSDLPGRLRSTTLSFLGRERRIPVGPQRMSLRLEVPLLVAFLKRRTASERRAGSPPFALEVHRLGQGRQPDECSEERLGRQLCAVLEGAILHYPADWLWMA